MSVVEVRPRVPDLGAQPVVPDPRPGLERCRLQVDQDAGTAVWVADGRRPRRTELRLGDAPGELAALVRAVYPPAMPGAWSTTLAAQLLLVDSTGAVLARAAMLPQAAFEQAWPTSLLARTGLPVQEARFRNSRTAQRAHRGAAPHWPVTAGFGWLLLTVTTSLLVVVLLVSVVVALTA